MRPDSVTEKPKIVVLCGSTRFSEAFHEANLRETLAGNIVLSIGCDMRSDADLFAHMTDDERADVKAKLDELHLRKIDLASEVLVLNVGGYVGESTRREIAYALEHGKNLRWLEDTGMIPVAKFERIGSDFGHVIVKTVEQATRLIEDEFDPDLPIDEWWPLRCEIIMMQEAEVDALPEGDWW